MILGLLELRFEFLGEPEICGSHTQVGGDGQWTMEQQGWQRDVRCLHLSE